MTATRTPLPAPSEKAAAVEAMFDRIAARYDRLNRLLTFGLDVGWRRVAVRDLDLPAASRVLDLACGTGDFCRELGRAGHMAVGVDFSAGMLDAARTNAPLVRADVVRLPMPTGVADGVTCGFALRNLVTLEPFLAECARVLRTGGRVALLDVGEPRSRVLRAGHSLYFRRIVPFVGGLLSDRAAYSYLPASTAYLPPPDDLVAMVRVAGFVAVQRRTFALGAAQLITGTRS